MKRYGALHHSMVCTSHCGSLWVCSILCSCYCTQAATAEQEVSGLQQKLVVLSLKRQCLQLKVTIKQVFKATPPSRLLYLTKFV